jgi:hypothetical protein
MGTRRIVFIGLTLLCALGGTSAFAAGQCQGGTLSTYLAAGFTCTQDNGILTFKSFVFNGPQSGLNSDQINVSPLDVPGTVGFTISGNFVVSAGQNATYVLGYFIDPPPIIHGEQLDLDPFGSVSLLEDLCISGPIQGCPAGNSLQLLATTANPTATAFFANTSTLGVQNTLTLTGGNTGANSQGFDNVTFIAPEPSGILLAASGLLGLLAFRSRAKLRKIRF